MKIPDEGAGEKSSQGYVYMCSVCTEKKSIYKYLVYIRIVGWASYRVFHMDGYVEF